MDLKHNIRSMSVIAHVDHGMKSIPSFFLYSFSCQDLGALSISFSNLGFSYDSKLLDVIVKLFKYGHV